MFAVVSEEMSQMMRMRVETRARRAHTARHVDAVLRVTYEKRHLTLEMTDAAAAPRPLRYVTYESEAQLQSITALIEKDLSEPYSVFTYR